METNDINYEKVGRNIRSLRNAYGQSALELSLDIGVGPTAISQYENGKRKPKRDIMLKIAKHFMITENELIYGDYSHMQNISDFPVNNKEYNASMIDKMFPIVFTEEARNNISFNKAYEIHLEQKDLFLQGSCEDSKIDECLDLYKKSYKEGVIEGIANSLWWLMLCGSSYSLASPTLIKSLKRLNGNEGTMKDIISGFLYSFDDECCEEFEEFQNNKVEFIKDIEVEIYARISILKKSSQYSELGDYYLALSYIFGLISNEKSLEMNRAIGLEMMSTFNLLGNKYAKGFMTPPLKK